MEQDLECGKLYFEKAEQLKYVGAVITNLKEYSYRFGKKGTSEKRLLIKLLILNNNISLLM